MPLYKYRAADTAGKSSDILIEGDTQVDSLTRLRQRVHWATARNDTGRRECPETARIYLTPIASKAHNRASRSCRDYEALERRLTPKTRS